MERATQGARIRALFENADDEVAVIAPFIKVDALRSLMEVIPADMHLRCVTRWLPRDIAAGVSDPGILDLLEARGNFNLSLVDRLHAKLYIAGDRCLAGSANVTLTGLGEGGDGSNIEVLVETTIDEPGVAETLEAIAQSERMATKAMAMAAQRLAESVRDLSKPPGGADADWFPESRRPERAYGIYTQPPIGFVGSAAQALLGDVARANLSPGISEREFREAIRALLAKIPVAGMLLAATEDTTLTRADAGSWLEAVSGDELSSNDLWIAFVNWMAFFFSDQVMKQEIAEIALRRAQLLG